MPLKRSAEKSAIMKKAAKRQETERARVRRANISETQREIEDSDRKMFIDSQLDNQRQF